MLIESAKRYEDIGGDKRKQSPAQKRNVGLILDWICFFRFHLDVWWFSIIFGIESFTQDVSNNINFDGLRIFLRGSFGSYSWWNVLFGSKTFRSPWTEATEAANGRKVCRVKAWSEGHRNPGSAWASEVGLVLSQSGMVAFGFLSLQISKFTAVGIFCLIISWWVRLRVINRSDRSS